MVKQLDPKAVWLFFVKGLLFSFLFFWWASTLLIPLLMVFLAPSESSVNQLFTTVMVIFFLATPFLAIVAGYIYAHLTWKNYRYESAPEGFKKESGIIWKRYVTIPYDRIQNVDIVRGVWARILGLSDLQIQTAGMSGIAGSEGRLPGLSQEDAEKLRDELIKRVKSPGRRQGL